jgi:hypothetical protein
MAADEYPDTANRFLRSTVLNLGIVGYASFFEELEGAKLFEVDIVSGQRHETSKVFYLDRSRK